MTNTVSMESPESIYWQYCQKHCSDDISYLPSQLKEDIQSTNWEEPESARDFNNVAVIALIESENAEDLSERLLYWEFALETLQHGSQLSESSLCKAHLAVIHSLIDDHQTSISLAYKYFLETLQLESISTTSLSLGLVYLPSHLQKWSIILKERLPILLQAKNGFEQAKGLLIEVLCHSRLCFYNANGFRFLQLASQFNSDSAILNLQLGISGFLNQQLESLAYLHQARKVKPDSSAIVQALYLAYRDFQQFDESESWKKIAATYLHNHPDSIQWKWAELDSNSSFTYVPFGDNFLLAVEPSFNSIVTSVLIAQEDWFESEMELWRDQLKPSMTVIDVGANAGVYTFSAAQLVGETGKVIAIEPFSGCVNYLQETRRINQLEWVKVLAGAASDRNGTSRLSLSSASELNELIPENTELTPQQNFETVACFTLDSLIDQENLTRVDWLKIDAEGHEIQVLAGCDRILQEFKPNILYENIAGNQGDNIEVAEYLTQRGYQLFRYRPYLKQLIAVTSFEELHGNLNLVAISVSKFGN